MSRRVIANLMVVGFFGLVPDVAAKQAAPPLVGPASIGTVEKPKTEATPNQAPTLELPDWVGQRFIFLPQALPLQHFGYQMFGLGYDEAVGKIVTVTKVGSGPIPTVEFRLESGRAVQAKAYGSSVRGIGPVADIEFARSHWLGKSLWLRGAELVAYDSATGKFGSVKLGRTARVNVAQVVAGAYEFQPVRFIMRGDDGREGFLDVQVSGTNAPGVLRGKSTFDQLFYDVNPRDLHKDWPAPVWAAIVDGKVFVGMTAEQAKMSWGEPTKINRTVVAGKESEQWVYGEATFLYVENGVVSAVQGGG